MAVFPWPQVKSWDPIPSQFARVNEMMSIGSPNFQGDCLVGGLGGYSDDQKFQQGLCLELLVS